VATFVFSWLQGRRYRNAFVVADNEFVAKLSFQKWLALHTHESQRPKAFDIEVMEDQQIYPGIDELSH
jgi:hypothetical protein